MVICLDHRVFSSDSFRLISWCWWYVGAIAFSFCFVSSD